MKNPEFLNWRISYLYPQSHMRNVARYQFHQHFSRAFFVQIFGAKPNVTRENDVRTKKSYVYH
jgi:hypothetical protein